MVDLIGDIVDFLIKSVLFKIIIYILFLAFILALFIEIAYFKVTGHINFTIFFNSNILGQLAWYYKKYIALLGITITFFYMALTLYLQNKIAKRKNCSLKEVELKQIAKIWLESESYKELIKSEVMEETQKETPKETKPEFIIPSFKNPRSYELFDFINKNKEAFSYEGVLIITDLIKTLENNPTSSVASKFKQDPNYVDYKKLITSDKTSYDILSSINLYTHTFNVVDETIKYIEDKYPKEKKIYLQRAIIAALAHDIGKIQTPLTTSTYELLKKSPHNTISSIILREKHPELDKDTIDAVEQHHGAIKNKNNFILKILLQADKTAREKEIRKWLIANQIVKKEKIENKEEIKTKEEITQETENEEENTFNINMEDIFSNSNEINYDGMKEALIKKVEDKLCNLKNTKIGLNLKELIFVKEHNIYISYTYLKIILEGNEEEFLNELKENKEGYTKELIIKAFGKEYKLILIIIKDEALGLDVSNVNCDEVEIKEKK